MRRACILTMVLLALAISSPLGAFAQQSEEQMAAYFFDRGEMEQAAQLYETLYRNTTNRYYYQRLLASYIAMEKYRDAMRLVEQRQKKYPKELQLFVDEGNIYDAQGQVKKARKSYDKAIAAIGNNQQPIPDLAQAFENAGKGDYVEQTYLTARGKTSNKSLYFNELTALYQRQGRYDKMTAEYFDLLDRQPGMMQSVQISMQRALAQASDEKLAEGIRRELVDRVQRQSDNKVYLEMMIWFALQQHDFLFALEQAEAVDARFPELGDEQMLRVASIAHEAGDLDVADAAYAKLKAKGPQTAQYMQSRIGELRVAFDRIARGGNIPIKELNALGEKYITLLDEMGRNENTVGLMRNYASLMAYHGGDAQAAVDMLDEVLNMPKLKATVRDEVKLELGDLLLFEGQMWDASLLYMQVDKSNRDDKVGAEAKFRNARLSYFNHDFSWAESQLKVLRSSTSKLIANDAMELSLLISDNIEDDSTYGMLAIFADADLLLFRGLLDSAWDGFDRIATLNLSHPLLDEVLMKKAEIRIKQARYAEADSLLQRLVDFYPYDITADDALLRLGEINENHLHNEKKALECYEKLVVEYPSSLYVDYARKRYNALKAK